uniref:Zinc finger CCHC domain-containing protein 8 n=1 Tax=Amphilophus citrinellus TaxID=61819 RepID=A0A3Q0QZG0_AMPCI
MAELDFGDNELFQQLDDSGPPLPTHLRFTDDEVEQDEKSQLRSRLEESDDYIQRLTEENILVALCASTSLHFGITVEDVNADGPLLQILYTNNIISNVLYFTTFNIDKLGQPLVNENAQLTEGWELPTYQQVFNQVIGTDGQEIEMKDKRPKSMCFNCGSSGHQLRDCPKPKDMIAINERRKEFNQSNNQAMQSNQRYHADEVEERFAKYKPGVMSEELLTALGIDENTLPPLIYRMRQLGYPPGWLKEAEMENSGLSLYDGNGKFLTKNKNLKINHIYFLYRKELVEKFKFLKSTEIRIFFFCLFFFLFFLQHQMMAVMLCGQKQCCHILNRCSVICSSAAEQYLINSLWMTLFLLTDPGTPYHVHGPGDFQFQPPLPPGSPCFSSPPPLPQGTPPATPTPPPLPKGTPPPTPTNGSPAVRGCDWVVVDETAEGTEDDMTLEELEEQQRQIMAALENADTTTNSDCETPAMQTPVPSSPSVSTSAHMDTETEDMDEEMDSMRPGEPSFSNEIQPDIQEGFSQSPGPVKVEDDSPQSPDPVKAQDSTPQSPEPMKAQDSTPQSPEPMKAQDSTPQSPEPMKSPKPIKAEADNPQSPESDFPNTVGGDCASVEKITAVPHRSKFAAGIVPFEDTPEFTEVAEATGTYLRIRDLLKNSPRSLAKKK